MPSGKSFTVTEVLAQPFDSDMEENVSETEDCVEEDPDFEQFSSAEDESVDTPVVSQPPAGTIPPKNGKIMDSFPTPTTGLTQCYAESIARSQAWFVAPPDTHSVILRISSHHVSST